LGSIITAEAALLTTGFGYGAGTLTGADALTQGLAISTVYQSGTATSVCIDNPESSECKEAVAWAAISWANVGTAANILNLSAQSAQYLNTAVNIVNIGAIFTMQTNHVLEKMLVVLVCFKCWCRTS
jgi:hypothetical protein